MAWRHQNSGIAAARQRKHQSVIIMRNLNIMAWHHRNSWQNISVSAAWRRKYPATSVKA